MCIRDSIDALELSVQRASHAWLEGHAVDGAPVVPVVLVAEWLTRAACSFRPGLVVTALHDLKVLKGIRLDGFENGGDRFRIEAQALRGAATAELQMLLRDVTGRPRYSARAALHAMPALADGEAPLPVLDAWPGAARRRARTTSPAGPERTSDRPAATTRSRTPERVRWC